MKYIVTAALMALPMAASAQVNCANTEDVYSIVRDKYQESRVLSGFSLSEHVTELWINPESGSWTAIVTRSDGISCIADQGTDVERSPLKGQL